MEWFWQRRYGLFRQGPSCRNNPDDAYKNFQQFSGLYRRIVCCIPVVTANASHNSWDWGEDVQWVPNDTRSFSYCVDQGDYWKWVGVGDNYGW